MPNKTLFKTIRPESKLQNLLESLSLTDNIELLQTLFSNLGYYILSNPQHSEFIIKFKPLYDKILLVLNQGPLTKTKLTLNFISSLMLAESSDNQSKSSALKMHAQNMIRISGCLSALVHLFTNSMLQHETWIALCQGLSEACCKCVLNQNYCTHLVPLCIQRCRRSNTEVLLVLHSLLINHDRNIKVFYESDGMSIFSRDNLLYTSYLRTLNTVIEGTKSSHRNYIKNSNSIFQCLRRWALTDHSGSAVTQWAVIVLYSRRKLLGEDSKLNDESMDFENDNGDVKNDSELDEVQDGSSEKDRTEYIENPNSETHDLFRNVMKEVYDYKAQNHIKRIPHIPLTNLKITNPNIPVRPKGNGTNDNMTHVLKRNPKNKSKSFLNHRKKGSAIFQHSMNRAAGDLSFSFLLNESRDANRRKLRSNTYSVKSTNKLLAPLDSREKSRLAHNNYRRSKLSEIAMNSQSETEMNTRRIKRIKDTPRKDTFGRTTCTSSEYEYNSEVIDFRPQRVSTPIHSRYSRKGNTPSNNKTVIKDVSFKRHSPKRMANLSMTSKFMDIINGSCTTIVRGLSKIKNVFVFKTSEVKDDVFDAGNTTRRIDCSYSFTNYMRKRDAIDRKANSRSKEKSINFSDALSSCETCNDTIILKHKLMQNPSLKECVKKLKLGINLYGCDFKKISRMLWPREPYMTPKVLYALYRKLIANEKKFANVHLIK